MRKMHIFIALQALWHYLFPRKKAKPEKKDENLRRVRYLIPLYCDTQGISLVNWQVHFLTVKTTNNLVTITITLSRPGLLIGKAGTIINGLTDFLKFHFEKKVKIEIVEYDPFGY